MPFEQTKQFSPERGKESIETEAVVDLSSLVLKTASAVLYSGFYALRDSRQGLKGKTESIFEGFGKGFKEAEKIEGAIDKYKYKDTCRTFEDLIERAASEEAKKVFVKYYEIYKKEQSEQKVKEQEDKEARDAIIGSLGILWKGLDKK